MEGITELQKKEIQLLQTSNLVWWETRNNAELDYNTEVASYTKQLKQVSNSFSNSYKEIITKVLCSYVSF